MTRTLSPFIVIPVISLVIVAAPAPARADCVEDLPSFTTTIRVYVSGQWVVDQVPIPFLDWGWGKWYRLQDDNQGACVTPARNCDDDSYDYWEISVTPGWYVDTTINGVPVSIDVDDTEQYWDWYYSAPSYTKVDYVDFSMNCHGYAFDTGNHPDDGSLGADLLLKNHTCYTSQYIYNADIALTSGHWHSMKVEGFYPCTNPYTAWEIYTSTSEKFRESGIYEQSGDCGAMPPQNGADPSQAHGSVSIENWTRK